MNVPSLNFNLGETIDALRDTLQAFCAAVTHACGSSSSAGGICACASALAGSIPRRR